ncbi:DUF4345 family protein [Hyphomonas sp. WL0036]|uniref:DUF4345 family protein n=1 Tax=Hyphomonas sediminis TaxID=2866160 RepID=UPI001C805362|nr:DUF4345 family protein [Hyphomonas sediminis]MBY9068498.1 DUF4345 family protein [Hyphomonas sediminis]
MYTKIFLTLMAALYLAFGLLSLLNPAGMTASLDVEIGGPNGLYEMRGIYGGVSLAAAALCAAGALRAAMTRPALWFITIYMGGYVFARFAALVLGPSPTSSYIGFVAFEVFALAAAVLLLRARRGA